MTSDFTGVFFFIMIWKLILLIGTTLLFSPPQVEEAELYGKCRITFYCPCEACCGEWAGGPTASGVMPTADHTAAADLPCGTRLRIDGQEYVVEDRGVSGMAVDIFVDSHAEALRRGMLEEDVYIIGN